MQATMQAIMQATMQAIMQIIMQTIMQKQKNVNAIYHTTHIGCVIIIFILIYKYYLVENKREL